MDALIAPVRDFLGPAWLPIWTLVKIVALVVPLILGVAYLTLVERKVIGYMQVRIGPNRVGPFGLLQPFADVFKLIFKEIIVPAGANRYLFFIAPMLALAPALAAWAVLGGGGLQPLAADAARLWADAAYGLRASGLDTIGPADPFAAVLAVLGSLWPGEPSRALVIIWLAALPLAKRNSAPRAR